MAIILAADDPAPASRLRASRAAATTRRVVAGFLIGSGSSSLVPKRAEIVPLDSITEGTLPGPGVPSLERTRKVLGNRLESAAKGRDGPVRESRGGAAMGARKCTEGKGNPGQVS